MFFFIANYVYFPSSFIHIYNGCNSSMDPDGNYYKLFDFLRSRNENIRLFYISLDTLTTDQKEKLKQLLSLKNIEDLNNLSYILSDSRGNFRPFFKDSSNLEISKRFITKIPKIDNLDELNLTLSKTSEEAIHIITTGHFNLTNKIIDKFYENSALFNSHTINFIKYKLGMKEMLAEDRFKSIINKDEALILFSPKYFMLNEIPNTYLEHIFTYDMKTKNLLPLSNDQNKTNLCLENNQFLAYKINIKPNEENNFNTNLEQFTNLIEKFLDGGETKYLLKPKIAANEKVNLFNFNPHRFLYTNNPELANYYKLKFVSEKSKLVFIYINQENLLKLNLDPEQVREEILKIIETNLSQSNDAFKYVVTYNPKISKFFNIFRKSNENITIRFIDYGTLVKFDENLKGEYNLFNLSDSVKNDIIKSSNKNLLFYYKSLYGKTNINDKELSQELQQFVNSQDNFFKSHKQYLENIWEINYMYSSKFEFINGKDFTKFIDLPGKKLLLGISENCIGCDTIKKVLESAYESKSSVMPKIFMYDIMNETIHFKKIKSAPMLFLYEGNKLIQEFDVNKLIQGSSDIFDQSYENAIKEVIETRIINNYF